MSFFQSMSDSIGKPILFVNRQTELQPYQNPDMSKALPPLISFGERLRFARKEARLTQKQLAVKVGMSQSNLSELENGEYPSSSFTAQIADALNVRGLWLAEGRGPRRSDETKEDAHETAVDARPEIDVRTLKLDALRQAVHAMAREFGVTPADLVSAGWQQEASKKPTGRPKVALPGVRVIDPSAPIPSGRLPLTPARANRAKRGAQ